MRKKLNLDGPDELLSYLHALQNEPRAFSRRHSSVWLTVIWARFSLKGLLPVTFVDGNHNATKSCKTLEDSLLPFMYQKHPTFRLFMQDKGSIHRAPLAKLWSSEKNS